jgi:hypothetical protein
VEGRGFDGLGTAFVALGAGMLGDHMLTFVPLRRHGLAQSSVPWWLKTTIKVVAACAILYWASDLFHS